MSNIVVMGRNFLEKLQRRKSLPTGPVDLEDRITADLLCVECGESLRGQSERKPCAT